MNLSNIFKRSLTNNFSALGINERNASLIYPNNDRKNYKYADDKILTKSILEKHQIACTKTYAIIERIGGIQTGWESVQKYDKVAIKPANGSGGGGIKILRKDTNGNWISSGKVVSNDDIYFHMANIIMGIFSLGSNDRVIIEECIEPHSFFQEIYPQGVPDFRVILLKEKPLLAMLRVPTDKSDGKANLHQGGIGIGIDMERGVLTQGYDGKSYFDNHPDNGNQILNKPIPLWEEVLTIAKKTAKYFPLNYLGADIVLDKNHGPLILEINVRPGLGIQMANKIGLKEILQKTNANW
ncbi:sugar-transfer associated ATP-grasp domain-containing protein [Pseudofulvibacter geojedonensis]|uniref:Sugar-transfer associated ATP-grasp domain-containing protein n=1 Tax=Pseudofulvibacter geojedonensis TaxID=1123758 RepID=A0ABW3I2N1_9FLAO